MKKRRELDALVNGKSGRRKKKGQHELLRNDTDSSDAEEYSIPDKAVVRKRSMAARFCSTCVAVSVFFLLTACVVTIGGLVWVHIDLKREVDNLRTQLHKVKSRSQDSPNEFHTLHSNIKDINDDITDIKTVAKFQGLNITEIHKMLGQFEATTQSLKLSLVEAPRLKELPAEVQQLREQLAGIGSDLETLKTNNKEVEGYQSFKNTIVDQLQELKTQLAELKSSASSNSEEPSASSRDVISLNNELQALTSKIETMNLTVNFKLSRINQNREEQLVLMTALQNLTGSLVNRVGLLESQVASAVDPAYTKNIISQEISKLNITSSGSIDSTLLQSLQTQVTYNYNSLTSLYSELNQMATSESVKNITERIDEMSLQMKEDMQDMTESMGYTTQKVTEIQTHLSDHDVRLGNLEQVQPSGTGGSSQSLEPPVQQMTAAPLIPVQTLQTEQTTKQPEPKPIEETTGEEITESRHIDTGDTGEEASKSLRSTRGSEQNSEEEEDQFDSLISALKKSTQ